MNDQSAKTQDAGRAGPENVFVVRFREPLAPGDATGRVECVASGVRASFGSTEELIAFMLDRLGAGTAEEEDDV